MIGIPDIVVTVGVSGGASISGESGQLILKELKAITSQMTGNNMPRVKVAVNMSETRKIFQQQLQQIVNGVNLNTTVKIKAGTGALQLFDTAKLEAKGKAYYTASANIIADIKKKFAGQSVDIDLFKDSEGKIQGFTTSLKKADTTIEKTRYKLAELTDGVSKFNGFVQVGTTEFDKTAGTNLNNTLNYLSGVEDKLANLTSRTTKSGAKPLLSGMPELDQYNARLQSVTSRIEEIRTSTNVLSDEHKREINSMVSDMQRYAKELQTAAYAGTDLKAQTFTAKKEQLQANLENQIKVWTNAGIFGGDFEQNANKAKALLDSATDSTGLDAYLQKLRMLEAEFKRFKIDKSVWDQIAKSNTFDTNLETARLRIKNMKTEYSAFVNDPALMKQWRGLFDQSQIVSSEKELTNLNASINQFEQKLISVGKHGPSMLSEMAQNAKKMANWMVMGTLLASVISGVKGIYTSVVNLDTAMVELKKVTNETGSAYNKFLTDASDRAVKLGTSLSDFTKATADFARLGDFTIKEAENLATFASVYQKVGDGVNGVEGATSSIITAMKAFGIAANDTMSIVDKYNEVGNNFAISSGGIGEAMQRSAASLAEANNTIDESIALIVAANDVTQDPDVVGTAWKTVAMRIRGAKAELEQAGLDTEGMVESTSKLRDVIMGLTNINGLGGIDILADDNTFKSTYQIMLEISKVWEKMSDVDQAALLELLAGKRQGNVVAGAIKNMDDAVKALETSLNSEGSAMAEHAKWMDSIQAKQEQFKAQYEDLANSILNSDLIKGSFDVGTGLLGWLTKLVDAIGALPPMLTVLSGINSAASNKGLFKLDDTKDWFGTGTGISVALHSKRKEAKLFEQQLSVDTAALEEWGRIIDSDKVSVETFKEAMKGASTEAKNYAVNMGDGTGNAEAFRNSQIAAAGATKSMGLKAKAASIGVQALNVAMNMAVTMGVSLIIHAIVAGLDSLINATSKASEKADEFAQKQRELSNDASTTVASLDELIDKYKELHDGNDLDAESRTEIKGIQEEIVSLVGAQADGIDLVNGKLDEELKKLRGIEVEAAGDAQDAAVAAYHAARESADSAVGQDKFLFMSGLDYTPSFGKRDTAGNNIIKDILDASGASIVRSNGIRTSGTAEERIEQLRAAMAALKADAEYDYSSSDLYSGLSAAASHYEDYITKVKEASATLVDSTVVLAARNQDLNGFVVNSTESYEKYRQSILNTVMADEALSAAMSDGALSTENITSAVDDLMARDFPEWYDSVINSGASAEGKSRGRAFASIEDAIKAAIAARDAYKQIQDDLGSSKDGTISLNTLSSLIGTYSSLSNTVSDYLSGAIDEKDILEILNEKYTEAAESAGYYKDITEELGGATSELGRQLNKLSGIKTNFGALSSALGEFKDNKIVQSDTLANLQKDFGNLEGFQNFVKVLGNSASSMAEVQAACNSLASEYISSSNFLDDLTEETKDFTIAQLESIGVTNAAEVVTGALAVKNAEATLAAENMTDATWAEAQMLLKEKGATEAAITGLQALRIEHYNSELAAARFTDASSAVIESLIQQGEAAGIAANKVANLRSALEYKTKAEDESLSPTMRGLYAGLSKLYLGQSEAEKPATSPAPTPRVSIQPPKSSKRSGSGSSKSTELYKAEIDRLYESTKRLKDIQNEISTLETKSDILDEPEYEKKNEYLQRTIELLEQENSVLNEQNTIRRQMIQEGVDKLRSQGFDVSYDASANNLLIKNMEHLNELYASNGNVEATNELRKSTESLIKDLQSLNNEATDTSLNWHENLAKMLDATKQLTANIKEAADEWTNDQEHNIKLMEHMGNRQDKIAATYMKMMNYVHDKAEEIRALMRANGKSEEYIANSDEIQALQDAWWEYYDALKAVREEQIDYLNDIIELTKDMIKQEKEDLIDALEAQKDEYKEIIELKKASIRLTERERTYNQKKKDYTDELQKLQLRADMLRLDDSREAQLELGSVMEEIADKQRELDDLQHEHSIDNQEDALDKELDMFEKAQNEKISEIKAFLANNQALTEAAMDRIDSEGAALFDDLLKYALHYTDTTEEELTKMWDNAMAAAQRYGSFVEAMGAYKAQLDVFENGDNASPESQENVIKQMQANSQAWHEADLAGDTEKKNQIRDETEGWGISLKADRDDFGYWWKDEKLLYGTDYYSDAEIVALMKRYSAAWNSASNTETQKKYADRASYLGTSLGANRDKNGVWWLDGQKLYDKKFHEGGIVGPHPTKDQTETMILARNGEAVLTEPMQKNMKNAFKSVQMMREQAFNLPDIHKFMENLRAGWNSLAGNIPNESFSKKQEQLPPINVESSVTINGHVDDHIKELLENHAYDIADIVAKRILPL